MRMPAKPHGTEIKEEHKKFENKKKENKKRQQHDCMRTHSSLCAFSS